MRKSSTVIRCDKRHLIARCRERGYTLEEVMPCVIEEAGSEFVVDTAHPAYPAVSRKPQPPRQNGGPGSQLKQMLKKVGIRATPTCSCNAHARVMDENGPDWCEEHIDDIVGWLKEEASRRGLPFWEQAGRALIKMAIRRARRGELGKDT